MYKDLYFNNCATAKPDQFDFLTAHPEEKLQQPFN